MLKNLSIFTICFVSSLGKIYSKDANVAELLSKSRKADHFEMISPDTETLVEKSDHSLEQSQEGSYRINLNLQQAGVFTIGNNTNTSVTYDLRVSINTDYIVVVGNECNVNCDKTQPYRKNTTITWA
jgi:hypothetical protein